MRSHWLEAHGFKTPTIGTFGVYLFFVHTCLVLMYSMERSHLDGAGLVKNFYIRRAFRIYPLSILAVLAAVALHLDSGVSGVAGLSRAEPVALGRIVSNLLLVQNLVKPGSIINVLWSLPFEVQMYFFLPFLFLWIRGNPRALRTLITLWLVSLPIALAQMKMRVFPIDRLAIAQYIPCFLPGIIAFVRPHTARVKSYLWLPFILILSALYITMPRVETAWVLCLILGFAIPLFAEIKMPWLRWISNRVATYSYGIYLAHQFCIWFVFDVMQGYPWWSRTAVLLVSLVAIPVALYHGMEKPFIGAGVRLAERWNPRAMVAARAVQ